jgi:hypothetical protein
VKYLCLVYPGEDFVPRREDAPDFAAAHRAMTEAGVYLDSGALQPSSATTTVTLREGETLLTDGPFAEIKEQVGGYFLLECADLDDAVKWAATIPAVRTRGASIEIRPLIAFGGRG